MLPPFYLKVGEFVIKVYPQFPYLEEYCHDFIVKEEKPRFIISISRDDIEEERKRADSSYPDELLEITSLHRKIAENLIFNDILVIHGSAVLFQNKAFIFTAPSGTGKSTHTHLLKELLGSEIHYINDDKPFLEIKKNETIVLSSPFNGKERRGENISGPLKALTLIRRDKRNFVEKKAGSESYKTLLMATYKSQNKTRMLYEFKLLDQVEKQITFYVLHCTPDIEAAKTSYKEILCA